MKVYILYARSTEGYPLVMSVFSSYSAMVLWLNLTIVKCLLLKTEHECTHDFHKMKVKKWFRWQY